MPNASQLNVVATIYSTIGDLLDERQRRLFLAAGARAVGRGGQTAVAEAAGVSRALVRRGEAELDGTDPGPGPERVRRPGGGRKRTVATDRSLLADLDRLISPDTRGDPESPLRWTCKSTRELADTLSKMGHQVSHALVGRLLREQGYSLQANAKVNEGRQHPDRDAQFVYLNERVREYLAEGAPSGWVAQVEELPGAISQGRTPEEAVEGVREAMGDWIAVALEDGVVIPEPRATADFSGRFVVRVPASLHADLVRNADREGVSLNQFVTGALAGAVGWPTTRRQRVRPKRPPRASNRARVRQ